MNMKGKCILTGHNYSDIAPEVADLIANRHIGDEGQLAPHLQTRGSCYAHSYVILGRFGHEWTEQLSKVTDSKTEEVGGREAVNRQTVAEALWLLRFREKYARLLAHHEAAQAERERLQREQHTSVPTFAPAPAFA